MPAGQGGPIVVGAVAVDIVPTTTGFLERLAAAILPEAKKVADQAGKEFKNPIQDGIEDGIRDGLKGSSEEAESAGKKAGKKFGGAFNVTAAAAVRAASRAIGKVDVDLKVDQDSFLAEVALAKKDAKALVGDALTIGLKIEDVDFLVKVGKLKTELAALRADAEIDIRTKFDLTKSIAELAALDESMQAANAGTGKFARTLDTTLKSALGDLPDPTIDLRLSGEPAVLRGISEVRGALAGLRLQGLDLSAADSVKEIKLVQAQLVELYAEVEHDPELGTDVKAALAHIATWLASFEAAKQEVEKPVEVKTKVDTSQLGFLKSSIANVVADMRKALGGDTFEELFGHLNLTGDITEIRSMAAEIKQVVKNGDATGELATNLLKAVEPADELIKRYDKMHGLDITPQLRAKQLQANAGQLVQDLAAKFAKVSAGIGIRPEIDTGKYNAELAAIKAETRDLSLKVGVDLSGSQAVAEAVVLRGRLKAILKDVTIDVQTRSEATGGIKELDAALKSVGVNSNDASGGVDKFIQRLSNMTPAAALANFQVVGLLVGIPVLASLASVAILGLIGLVVTLGAALGAAALGLGVIALVFSKVTSAIKAKEAAEKAAATNALQDEQTALSNKIALSNADRQIAAAQKTLATATTRESTARKDLNKSYKTARDDLKKLTAEIKANQVAQQSAIVSITQAREAYNRILADPTASESDVEAAQAQYNTQEANLKKLQADQQANQTKKAQFDKVGLAADDAVISAQKELKDAIQAVADARTGLANQKDDKANTIKQQAAAAKVTTQQRADVSKNYDDASPAVKEFADFYEKNIKPAFADLAKSAVDSGLLKSIEGFFLDIKPLLPDINKLFGTIGASVGYFIAILGKVLSGKDGKDFIKFLQKEIPVAFGLFAGAAQKILPFIFHLIEDLAPIAEKLGPKLIGVFGSLADKFSKFADKKGKGGLTDLIDQIVDAAPKVINFLVVLIPALVTIVQALAPVGVAFGFVIELLAKLISYLGPVGISGTIGILVLDLQLLLKNWDAIWGKIQKIAKEAWDAIRRVVSGGMDLVRVDIALKISTVRGLWHDFWDDGIVRKTHDAWEAVKTAVSNAFKDVKQKFSDGVSALGLIWGGFKSLLAVPIHGFFQLVNDGFIAGFNKVASYLPGKIHIDPLKEPASISSAASLAVSALKNSFATGTGYVDGRRGMMLPGFRPGVDEVPSLLSQGEAVLVPQVARHIGRDTIEAWNADGLAGRKLRRFAGGTGSVDLVPEIIAFERRSGVPFNVTSTYRAGDPGYHGKHMAVDVASNTANMVRQANWEYGYSPYLLELIHSAGNNGNGFFVKNGKKVNADFYRSVYDEHFSHVHTAMNRAGLTAAQVGAAAPSFSGTDTGSDSGGLVSTFLGWISDLVKPAEEKFTSLAGGNNLISKLMLAGPSRLLTGANTAIVDGVKQLAGEVLSVGHSITDFLGITDSAKDSAKTKHADGDMASPLTAAKYAKSKMGTYNWTPDDFYSLGQLWNGESGWRWNAKNASSGAYGIPQSLPGSKMGAAGQDWPINAFTQVDWGLAYIASVYGDPGAAYTKWLSREPHWYDQGGHLPPGLTLAYNGTGKNEHVFTDDQLRDMRAGRNANVGVTVRVQDGAVPGLIVAEVDRQFGQLADASIYGGA